MAAGAVARLAQRQRPSSHGGRRGRGGDTPVLMFHPTLWDESRILGRGENAGWIRAARTVPTRQVTRYQQESSSRDALRFRESPDAAEWEPSIVPSIPKAQSRLP